MLAARSVMSELPEVSVITPTKNRCQLLCETIDLVFAQSFLDWEHIVVDDGSEDATAEEVERRCLMDHRLRFIRRNGTRSGANVCRNIGFRESRGKFIVFLDSDDLLERNCLKHRIAIMRRNADLDFATFQAGVFINIINDLGRVFDDQLLGDDLVRFLYFEAPWQTSAPIWRRDSLHRIGLFDESLLSWQDIELHVRALARGAHYIRFSEVDHHIRWNHAEDKVSFQQHRSPDHLMGAIHVIRVLEQHVRGGPGMNWVRQRALCRLYLFVAERWIEQGKLREALSAWQNIRTRGIGSRGLYVWGAILLILLRVFPMETFLRKWKGWVRLRSLPEIVPP